MRAKSFLLYLAVFILSGLFAACVASRQGKKVKILSYGESTLTIGSGIIDVLGYDDDGNFVANPIEGIKNVAKHHPYAKIENDVAKKALLYTMKCKYSNIFIS